MNIAFRLGPRCRAALVLGLAAVLAGCGGGTADSPAVRANGAAAVSAAATPALADGSKHALAADAGTELSDLEALAYVASYPDLVQAIGTDLARARAHYAIASRTEGRRIGFSPLLYTASHPDLITAFGTDEELATRHFIRLGARQNRRVDFDALGYLASFPEVANRLGLDPVAAARDYIEEGYAAGRRVNFNPLRYIARYADLIAAFGADVVAATRHFIAGGRAEGRSDSFDAAQYLRNYADLQASYGTDLDAATLHYILAGRAEGRTDAAPNRAPSAAIVADQLVPIGGTLRLDGSTSSDPDGNALRYQWRLAERPARSAATLGSPASAIAGLSPDVGGRYLVELVVSDGSLSSPAATVEVLAATPVSGILSSSTTWTADQSPYLLTGSVGVAHGAVLTLAAGTEVRGQGQQLMVGGTLDIRGTRDARVRVVDTRIVPAGTSGQPHDIRMQFADVQGGTLYAPTGLGIYGTLNVSDSDLFPGEYIYLWYPTGDSSIVRSRVGVRISYGLSGNVTLTLRNNLLLSTLENWALYSPSRADISGNTFGPGGGAILPIGYGSAAMDLRLNYWGTTEPAAIAARIFDRNDDLRSAGVVPFEPFLTAPAAETPR